MSRYQKNRSLLYLPQYDLYKRTFIVKNGIKSLTTTAHREKGKVVTQKTFFDKNGMIEKVEKKGDTTYYSYLKDTILSTVLTHGKDVVEIKYSYLHGKRISKETYKNGELISLFLTHYTEDDRISFSSLQNGRKLKNNYLLKYYYENENLTAQNFYIKGKLNRKWDYSCSEKGKEIKKTTVQFCEYEEENNDGSYIKYNRRQKGAFIHLNKRYYTKDSILFKTEDVGANGKVFRKTMHYRDSSTIESLDKKSRVYRSRKVYYNKERKVLKSIEKSFSANKLLRLTVRVFDDKQRLIKWTTTHGRKQNKEYTYTKTYDSKGLIRSHKSAHKEKTNVFLAYDYEFYE